MRGVELVVLDMAGTTMEEGGQVYLALGEALSDNGIPVDEDELRELMGASKREVVRHFVRKDGGSEGAENEVKTDQTYASFRKSLRRRYADGGAVRPVDGAEEAFAWLRDRGVKVALTTGFDREIANALLERLGWDAGAVDAVVCGDDVPTGRPAPYMIHRAMEAAGVLDVGEVVVVGDTALDLRAGTNSGACYVVGVLSGGQSPEDLGRVAHTHIVLSVAALPGLIERELVRDDG